MSRVQLSARQDRGADGVEAVMIDKRNRWLAP